MTKQAVFNLALKVFLFLSPIFFFREHHLSYAQGMFFVFASFALFGISLGLEQRRKFSSPWLALLLLWALIRVFVGGDFDNVASEWFNFWISSAGFIYVLAGVLLFYTVYCHAEDPKDYLKPILLVCIMNSILVIAQLSGHDFMWTRAPSIGGFVGISSQLGQYSAMGLPVLAFINPWLAIVPAFTLFVAKSISSIIAVFIGAGLYFWFKSLNSATYKKASILPIGILVITALVLGFFNRQSISAKWQCRPVMWEKTLRVALQKPYLGHGYRSFYNKIVGAKTVCSIGGLEFSRPHSDPLHTVQELGFPSMIFIGRFFIGLWRKFKARKDKDKLTYILAASILIVLINCCGQTLIRYASIAGTFIVLLAFLNIKLQGE